MRFAGTLTGIEWAAALIREGVGMRAVAGGLVVIAGGMLWRTGAIAVTLAYGIAGNRTEPGGWATLAGIVLILTGLGIIARDVFSAPPPATPPA
jgi:hypothetical protein